MNMLDFAAQLSEAASSGTRFCDLPAHLQGYADPDEYVETLEGFDFDDADERVFVTCTECGARVTGGLELGEHLEWHERQDPA